jgi:hypothetical protein
MQLLWEILAVPQNVNMELPSDLAILLLGIQKKNENLYPHKIVHKCS